MALNQCVFMGRITHDLEIRTTQSGISVLSFTIAVDRSYCKQGEERQADFIDCVAWRNHAEFINNYFAKGRMIAVTGEMQTRIYEDKNGVKHKATELIINHATFTGEKSPDAQPRAQPAAAPSAAPPPPSEPPAPNFGNVAADDDYPF